jgi:hypothetical protein
MALQVVLLSLMLIFLITSSKITEGILIIYIHNYIYIYIYKFFCLKTICYYVGILYYKLLFILVPNMQSETFSHKTLSIIRGEIYQM